VRSALVWNVRGLTSAGTASLHERHQFLDNFDFVFLCETQLIAPPSHLLPDHDLHSLPADTAGRPGEGLLLAVRRSLGLVTIPWPVDPKSGTLWVQVRQPGSGKRYMLGSGYIPPSASHQLRRLTADWFPLSAERRFGELRRRAGQFDPCPRADGTSPRAAYAPVWAPDAGQPRTTSDDPGTRRGAKREILHCPSLTQAD